MKKNIIKALLSLVLFAGVFYACSENSDEKQTITLKSNADASPTIGNSTIGYIDNGAFVAINQAQLVGYWKYKHSLPEDTNFSNIQVIGGTSENGQELYTVSSRSDNGNINVVSILKPFGSQGSAMYMMQGSTCSCQSISCSSTTGCQASTTNGCVCSACGGDCKKTSTVETSFARVFAYLKSIGIGVAK